MRSSSGLPFLLLIPPLLGWAVVFALSIYSDLHRFRIGMREIFRLYITDLWAIIVGLLPAMWLASLLIRGWPENPVRVNVAACFGILIALLSQLLGVVRAAIHVAPKPNGITPTRLQRALWFCFGAYYGLALMLLGVFIGGVASAVIAAILNLSP